MVFETSVFLEFSVDLLRREGSLPTLRKRLLRVSAPHTLITTVFRPEVHLTLRVNLLLFYD